MKHYFSENLNSMTFVFSFIIILNALLGYLGDANRFVLGLTMLIIVLFSFAHAVTYINFRSNKAYHLFNFIGQFIILVVIASLMGLVTVTLNGLVTNGIIFATLYFLTTRMRKHRINQLANAINEQLSKRDKF
ncbi:hypothetical protein LHA31_09170 [Carnobacterium viridans]|uniref:Uncharacterized protein n=1 Tax=Carnobacterium viridans TaxID=174587 RepID=A0A1H0Z9B4_9LACT|nr:hypothetical protein [Carnobacterium viridans]UDE94742.1 hypothetical protein LHA31_09170 [Carnobacterium viridans]SDQ24049.1 hypothetical protein SAMN04487752_1391 [Carnobacterium viridans]